MASEPIQNCCYRVFLGETTHVNFQPQTRESKRGLRKDVQIKNSSKKGQQSMEQVYSLRGYKKSQNLKQG